MSRPAVVSILLALIAAHVALAIGFASATPWRTAGRIMGAVQQDVGAPDERQHANYVRTLASERRFPVFRPGAPDLYETYQAHQPPLYYALGAVWTGGDVEPRDAGLRLRALNVLIGAAGVAGVFFASWWGFRSERAAIAATAVAALLPMNAALSGAASNDPLLIALGAWTFAVLALCVREGWTMGRAVWVAVLAGAAMLTKTTALALFPVIVAAVLLKGPSLKELGVALIGPALIAAPWWIRNQGLYGDPFALRAFTEAFAGSAQKATFVNEIIPAQQPGASPEIAYWKDWVGFWTGRSLVGTFGYMDVWLTPNGRNSSKIADNALYWTTLLLLVGGGLAGLRALFAPKERPTAVLSLVFGAVVLGLFVRFNLQYFQAQARYLYPSLAAWAGIVGFGLAASKRYSGLLIALTVVLLGGTSAFAVAKLPGWFAERTAVASGG